MYIYLVSLLLFFWTTWVLFDVQAEARKVLKNLNVTVEHFDCKLLHF